jgi:hypothetical protein
MNSIERGFSQYEVIYLINLPISRKPPYKGKTSAYSEKFTPYHIDACASFIPTVTPSLERLPIELMV